MRGLYYNANLPCEMQVYSMPLPSSTNYATFVICCDRALGLETSGSSAPFACLLLSAALLYGFLRKIIDIHYQLYVLCSVSPKLLHRMKKRRPGSFETISNDIIEAMD